MLIEQFTLVPNESAGKFKSKGLECVVVNVGAPALMLGRPGGAVPSVGVNQRTETLCISRQHCELRATAEALFAKQMSKTVLQRMFVQGGNNSRGYQRTQQLGDAVLRLQHGDELCLVSPTGEFCYKVVAQQATMQTALQPIASSVAGEESQQREESQ